MLSIGGDRIGCFSGRRICWVENLRPGEPDLTDFSRGVLGDPRQDSYLLLC